MHTPNHVIIVGAGGHGREVAHVLRARHRAGLAGPVLVGFADDGAVDETLLAPFAPHLGAIATATERHPNAVVLGGVGNGRLRRRLVDALPPASPAVHPSADVGDDVELGAGTVVCSHVSVTTNVVTGRHVHLSRGAAIGHDAVLGDYVSVMPLAAVSGGVYLDEEAFVGTGALIRQGVRVGAGAVVGMGAVVLEDVPPGVTVVGNPARELRAGE
ncbi:acetyltransferase [Nostocoides sp. F2B08]|uniref:acetyltransferase n=1 Tax=Nostocoides sp. F2B08 TaxID=2653936 RepID=UPI00186AF7F4|nr:acetyltransferase [Tetrasphaera sp. F2B08]